MSSVQQTRIMTNTDFQLVVHELGCLDEHSLYSREISDVLLKLKQEGKILAIGASIHDRKRAGRLALNREITTPQSAQTAWITFLLHDNI
ncbi:MAG: hypothetical protein AB9866_24815 [Syntrophobacteraceae bacterium]